MSVKPGLGPKEIAILHYQLIMENNKEEWLKTIMKMKIGISSNTWWKTGRKYIDKKGWSYKFRHEDDRPMFHKENSRKFFFYRLNEKGEEQGAGPVPIIINKDPDNNDEWRVKVSSW